MKHPVKDELWECPECGARIAIGKYAPLQRWGRRDCGAELVEVPIEDADALLETRSNVEVRQ